MHIDSIIFDLDGTLWDSVDEIILTWNLVISRHSGLRLPISRKEQESVMGLQMNEIADRLFPSLPPADRMLLMEECILEENQYLSDHGGKLYPDVQETLEHLGENYRLFIVSNCQSGYIEAFLKAHRLGHIFEGFLCYGDTKKCKGENNRQVVEQYHLQYPVYVGDTLGDQMAAQYAGIPFVFAEYGFGQAENFVASVSSFRALADLFVQ